MKKLINLIALVMLVSTNVLTPFSYAEVENPEVIPENGEETVEECLGEVEEIPEINEETPELVSEEKGELEQENAENVAPENVLPNIQDDEETPVTDETEEENTESDGVAQPVEETPEKEIQDEEENFEELEKVEESVVMDVIPNTSVMLLPGQEFNSVIKTLANGGTYVAYTGVDNNIQSFERVDEIPQGVTTGEISVAGSEYPVHAWFSGGILYYTTQAEIIQLNKNSQQMFYNCSELGELDLSNFDTSNVTNMNGIFAGCSKLEEINLNGWDFRNTSVNMMNMTYGGLPLLKKINMQNTKFSGSLASAFAGLSNVEEIDLRGADTSNVTNIGSMFGGCSKLEKLNLEGWILTGNISNMFGGLSTLKEINLDGVNTKGVTNMSSMFGGCSSLIGLDLSSFDTSNVINMGGMLGGSSKLEELNLSGWDFRKSASTPKNLFGEENGSYCSSSCNLKKLNLTNVKFGQSMNSAFMDFRNLEELKIDGIDTSDVTDMRYMFKYCSSNLTGLDLSNFDTSNVTDMFQIFAGCYDLEMLNLSGWDFHHIPSYAYAYGLIGDFFSSSPSKLKILDMTNAKFPGNMSYAFRDLVGLEELKLDGVVTSGVTNMSYMFYNCKKLTGLNLDTFDTSNVTDMSFMFRNSSSLTGLDLRNFDTSSVTSMGNIFNGCSKLEDLNLSGWDLSNSPNMGSMFYGASNLKTVSMKNWTIPENFTNAIGCRTSSLCATGIENIDVSNWNLNGVKNLEGLFGDLKAKEIKGLNTWDTSGVSNMGGMFYNCSNLNGLNLSGRDTSSVTNMGQMFQGCSNLTGLDLSDFDTSKVADMGGMFIDCNKLEELNLSGWDFRKYGSKNLSRNLLNAYDHPLKRLNLTNAKFSGSMYGAFEWLSLEEINLDGVDTANVNSMSSMFHSNRTNKIKNLDLSSFDTSQVTDMGGMFNGCEVENLNLSGWDFRKYDVSGLLYHLFPSGTNGSKMKLKNLNLTNAKFSGSMNQAFFSRDSNPTLEQIILDGVSTSRVNSMNGMFGGQKLLKWLDLSSFDTSSVTNMGEMFWTCESLTGLDLSNFDTSKVTNMQSMFSNCSKLEEINLSGWDFRNISNASLMMNITAGGIPSLTKLNMTNTKYTGNASYAFGRLTNLEELKLDGADTRGVTNMSQMFQNCSNLTGLDLSSFDTSNVTDMQSMFNWCSKLENLDLDNWDLGKNPNMGGFIVSTPSLKSISMSGWKIPENFQDKIGRNRGYPNNTIEEIDVTNWDLNKTKNLQGLFGDTKALKTIKGLDTWDTSGVTNMYSLFYNCNNLTRLDLSNWDTSNVTNMYTMFYGCSSLTGLDLSNWDTSNVVDMGAMFNGCSNLAGLDLSNWDTSNVNNVGGMFGGCSKLEEINLSGWDFRNVSNNNLMMGITAGGIPSLTKLNMINTKYTGNATYAFGGLTKLEELNLDGADTSNVTSMNAMFNGDSNLKNLDLSSFDTSNVKDMAAMFYNCSSLTGLTLSSFDTSNVMSMGAMFYQCSGLNELDLSNFDTSRVTTIGQMFYNTPNLKTIYASEKFVTIALSGDTSSKDMFSGTTNVIGGNGTKFDPNYIDKTYALIDKVGQTGYFTDKNAINVKFINTLDGTETISTFKKGQKLTPPPVNGYHAVGGYLDEAMTQKIDLNKGVDSYSEIYVKYERNGSSGGGGGGGGGATKPDTPKEEQKPADSSEQVPQNDNSASSGSNVKTPENDTQMDSQIGEQSSVEQPEGQGNGRSNTSDNSYTNEQKEAYAFAKENGITTMPTIQKADMSGKLTRIQMAKMLSQYAMNVLGQTPDTSKTIKFKDVTVKRDADYDNGVTLAYQLGIMGQNMPGNNFRPNDEVSRAEFVTALSRLLYSTSDGEYKSTSKYYVHHMEKLVKEGIITNDDPKMKERRGYVMIMLMRSAK